MFHRILVPLDGSTLGELALPYAEALARSTGAQLIVVRPVPASGAPEGDRPAKEIALLGQAQDYVSVVARDVVERGSQAYSAAARGSAWETILQAIRCWQADLVVAASSPRFGLAAWLRPATLDRVVAGSPVPVLLVATAHTETVPSALVDSPCVLVPLDSSAYAERALPVAEEWAGRFGGRCVLLHVVEPSVLAPFDDCLVYQESRGLCTDQARQYLEAAADISRTRVPALRDIRVGDTAAGIVQAARDHAAALTVMSTHARTGLQRWLMGSVAATAIRRGRAPILLIGPRCHHPHSASSQVLAAPTRTERIPPVNRHRSFAASQAAGMTMTAGPIRPGSCSERGSSPVEQLYVALQAHRTSAQDVLAHYRRLASTIKDPVASFLVNVIADGKERHQHLLERIEASLRDALQWTRSPQALPDGQAPDSPATITAARQLIRSEQQQQRSARELAKAYAGIDVGLDSLLLETFALDNAKHQRILHFALRRLREHREGEGLPERSPRLNKDFEASWPEPRLVYATIKPDGHRGREHSTPK